MEEHIEDIKEAEQEESQNEEESPYYVKKWADVEEQFNKVEEHKTEHEDLVCKIRLMCGFILKQGGEGVVASKIQSDAQEALIDVEKAEIEVERNVRKFRKTNRTYLVGRKKKQTPQATESQEDPPVAIDSDWILQMSSKMDPEGNLKNNSELTEMRAWKKQWIQYTSYLRDKKFPLDNKLYAQMLLSRCDAGMKLPLEAMEDIYEVGGT